MSDWEVERYPISERTKQVDVIELNCKWVDLTDVVQYIKALEKNFLSPPPIFGVMSEVQVKNLEELREKYL